MEDNSPQMSPETMVGMYQRINELKAEIKSALPLVDDSELGMKMKSNIEWSSKYIIQRETEILNQIKLVDLYPYSTQ